MGISFCTKYACSPFPTAEVKNDVFTTYLETSEKLITVIKEPPTLNGIHQANPSWVS